MEDLFMYGPSGLGVDDCKLFMDDLEGVKEESVMSIPEPQLFIPSPQTMLHTAGDPFSGIDFADPAIKQEVSNDEFDQIFGIPQESWVSQTEARQGDGRQSISAAAASASLGGSFDGPVCQVPPPQRQPQPQQAWDFEYYRQSMPGPRPDQTVNPMNPLVQGMNPAMQNMATVPGSVSQSLQGSLQGSIPGSVPNSMSGSLPNSMPGSATGSVSGSNGQPGATPPRTGYLSPPQDANTYYDHSNVVAPTDTRRESAGYDYEYKEETHMGPVGVSVTGAVCKNTSNMQARQRKPKSSHNMIEKRYRNNINDKINQLRDCVPSLREAAEAATATDGLANVRLNKATVLSTAADYILQLQRRNRMLEKELHELRSQTGGLSRGPRSALPSPPEHATGANSGVSRGGKVAAACGTVGLVAMGGMRSDEDLRGLAALPLPLPLMLGGGSITFGGLVRFTTLLAMAVTGLSIVHSLLSPPPPPPPAKAMLAGKTELQQQRTAAHETAARRLSLPARDSTVALLWALLSYVPLLVLQHLFGQSGYQTVVDGANHDLRQQQLYVRQAADMQLVGGDLPLSKRRMALLYVRKCLNPAIPRRFLVQSVQMHVLGAGTVLQPLTDWLAAGLWQRARNAAAVTPSESNLSPHLRKLVQLDFDTVLSKRHRDFLDHFVRGMPIPGNHNFAMCTQDSQLNSVLDVLAALVSHSLQDAVLCENLSTHKVPYDALELAASLAPPQSWADVRVSVLQALLQGRNEPEKLAKAMHTIADAQRMRTALPAQFCVTMACAIAVYHSRRAAGATGDVDAAEREHSRAYSRQLAAQLAADDSMINCDMLCVVLALTLEELAKDDGMRGKANLADIASMVRVWLGRPHSSDFGLSVRRRRELVTEVLELGAFFAGHGTAAVVV